MTAPVPTDQLIETLTALFAAHGCTVGDIVDLTRSPSAYRTSFALEEVDLQCANGMTIPIMFKQLSRAALLTTAHHAKPLFLFDPCREIRTYETVLAPTWMGTARLYGAVVEPEQDRYWLFIERVRGKELYQIGEFATWMEAARWLASLHQRFTDRTDALPPTFRASAVRYDAAFFSCWPTRALAYMRRQGSITPEGAQALKRLISRYDSVITHLCTLPHTVLHGEYVASNVLVRDEPGRGAVCPIDWEMAAIGPGLIDLAALIAGSWTEEEKIHLALSYYQALDRRVRAAHNKKAFLTSLTYCRLHLAMQWLGWSGNWSPPLAHAYDWLSEALTLAERLGL